MPHNIWPPPPTEQPQPLPISTSPPPAERLALGLSLLGSFLLVLALYFLELRPSPFQGTAGWERSESDEQSALLLGLSSLVLMFLGLLIGTFRHNSWAGRGAVVLPVATVALAVLAVIAGSYRSYP